MAGRKRIVEAPVFKTWEEVDAALKEAVSYTHLDVYKRQVVYQIALRMSRGLGVLT